METGKNQEIDPQSLSLDDDKELIEFDQCIFDLRSEYIHKQNVFTGKITWKTLYMKQSNAIMQNNIRLIRVIIK